jgi:hypothetical protein
MERQPLIPDFEWYSKCGTALGLPPRCPFASADTCPRYYFSLYLMGKTGATKIPADEDKRLERKWRYTALWPTTTEQEPSVGQSESFVSYSNFCPEVSFDRFNVFATSYADYADEIDRDFAHQELGKIGASRHDWRWRWAALRPMHYAECPIYAPLTLPQKSSVMVNIAVAGYEIIKVSISPWWAKFITTWFHKGLNYFSLLLRSYYLRLPSRRPQSGERRD